MQQTSYSDSSIIESAFLSRMGDKRNVNLYNELLAAADKGRTTTIIEDPLGKVTYKRLLLSIQVVSAVLAEHLDGQPKVGVLLPNVIGNVVTLFSLFKLGVTPCMLNFSMGAESIAECCATAEVKKVITSKAFIEKGGLDAIVKHLSSTVQFIYLEDIQKQVNFGHKLNGFVRYALKRRTAHQSNEIILFTSGTESKPKGVVLTHDNLYANVNQMLSVIHFMPSDLIFNALPMFHCFGLLLVLLGAINDLPVYLYPNPLHYREIPSSIRKTKATIICGTSTFFEGYGLNANEGDLASLRLVIAGAEKLKEEVAKLWQERFGIHIFEGYGVTETSPVISTNTPDVRKPGTVGRLAPGMEYRINPVEGIASGGTLVVKGPNVMKGYLIHGKGFVPCDGWHDCGDVVTVDDEGFITIQSRLKRFAKIAGEMVALGHVEKLASGCFEHAGFYAVSIPDSKKGERIVLFSTKEDTDLNSLKKYIKQEKISSLYIPSQIHNLAEVPILGTGKTNYVQLMEQARQLENEITTLG
ncbi:AMP-binding protein [Paenibacillus albus]|uniref:Bifunctional acyl-ACP--phospholipid O-acyltransferase/long-chain-fatty-acid--ACP ligase n=1 Tax=Paenibacillus albus TaxID=2495582 RepID=A0A3S9ABF1_9BACL|nr:AMP-binding protein [Paenibacillus albus]AZN43089.1 bifunctional acyl-ACP--phospholipid O-acyltransferase/long-chain-fatty-acid--ACP ligase [Paenibacillus albus]